MAGEATDKTITYGRTLCGSTESRTEAETAGGETKILDLGGDVEAHRRESLHAPGPAVREGGHEAVVKAVQVSLAKDRRRRAEEAGAEVEALVKADPPLIQEAWYPLQGWYKAAVDRALPPARATLRRVTAERVTLYSQIPPPPGRHHPGHHRAVHGGGWRPYGGEN